MMESLASELNNSRLFIRDYNSNCTNILKVAKKNYADQKGCKKRISSKQLQTDNMIFSNVKKNILLARHPVTPRDN